MYIHQRLLHVRMNTIRIVEILRFPLLIRLSVLLVKFNFIKKTSDTFSPSSLNGVIFIILISDLNSL